MNRAKVIYQGISKLDECPLCGIRDVQYFMKQGTDTFWQCFNCSLAHSRVTHVTAEIDISRPSGSTETDYSINHPQEHS